LLLELEDSQSWEIEPLNATVCSKESAENFNFVKEKIQQLAIKNRFKSVLTLNNECKSASSNSQLKYNFIYRWIAWVGVYSYGIYLWHTVTIQPGEKLAKLLLSYGVDEIGIWIIVMAFQIVFSLILGCITTLMVEWPFLRLRERFYPSVKEALKK
jgi:hypothetical protein